MCGITGFVSPSLEGNSEGMREILNRMTTAIAHRGPDDEGTWTDERVGLGLGFRRLSIVDLSSHGHQPMCSASQRYVIVFNGEIYNAEDLRKQLRSSAGFEWDFKGRSDTEVLLAALSHWGVEKTLAQLNGMFAFAFWDRELRQLTLARDRLGIKPLYYGQSGRSLIFASELKPFRQHPEFHPEVDLDASTLFFRYNYVPAPFSIYRGVRKLLPGTYATLKAPEWKVDRPTRYWSLREKASDGKAHGFTGTEEDARKQLEELLRDSVRMRMIADVPLGSFLSGGVDSSLVTALMQSVSDRPVKTFSMGFEEDAYNEAGFAKEVATHLGTDHTEWYISPKQALETVPRLSHLYDEPFADSSQIPTLLVSELAKTKVTVALSGDGGDELFGGYNRYFWGSRLWGKFSGLPLPLRRQISKGIQFLSPEVWDRAYPALEPLVPSRFKIRNPSHKVKKFSEILKSESSDELYYQLVSHWMEPEKLVRNGKEPITQLTDRTLAPPMENISERMMYLDTLTYLPDDILTKVDRASMGVGLEARVPLLDYRVVEFAWTLPLQMKVKNGVGKSLLREVLYRHVPRELIERPKMGFALPVGEWLRSDLREWAEDLLSHESLSSSGLNPDPILCSWKDHVDGKANLQADLWGVLMYQDWKRRYL